MPWHEISMADPNSGSIKHHTQAEKITLGMRMNAIFIIFP